MSKARTFPETGIWKYTVNTVLVVLAAATLTFASADQSMAGAPLSHGDEKSHLAGDAGDRNFPGL